MTQDTDIRPATFESFIGQEKAKRVLQILCQSAKKRGTACSHVLLSGPPGLGKTTLARIIAHEMGSRLIELVASHVQAAEDLVGHLRGVKAGDVLFIDELHGLPRAVEEALYSAMEEFRLAIPQEGFDKLMRQLGVSSPAPTAQIVDLPRFTVVGATTLAGLVSDPLRSRFVQTVNLVPYSDGDLQRMVMEVSAKMGFPIAPEIAIRIAWRSRETARIAIGLLRWLADYCEATDRTPNIETLDECMELREVDVEGFTRQDRLYLRTLIDAGAPLGLSTLAATLGESRETLEQAVEPFLIRRGYVRKGPRGRVALPKARDKVVGCTDA